MPAGRTWTTREAKIARAMRADRKTAPVIAQELGRTAASVYGFLNYRYVPKYRPKANPVWTGR